MTAEPEGRISGAEIVFVIDPIAKRRAVAGAYGAETLDPTECDVVQTLVVQTLVVQTLKDRTDGKGVDVAIEASASYRALGQAIRSVVNRGTVDALSVYPGPATDLDLAGGAWHLNQVTLKSSRNVSYPVRDSGLPSLGPRSGGRVLL